MANVINITTSAEYDTLVDAVSAVNSNEVIQLQTDLSGAGVGIWEANQKANLVIDLNGKTYTCVGPAVGSAGTKNQAFHLEANSQHVPSNITIKNGKVNVESGKGIKMLIQNYSNLTLDGVVLDGTNLDGANRYVESNNNGSVTIKNSTIIAKEGDFAFDVCGYDVYPNVSVTTVNSTINGNVEVSKSEGGNHNMALQLGAGTKVSGAVKSDASITSAYVNNGFTFTKAPDVNVTLSGDTFSQMAFSGNGKMITKEEKAKEDADNSAGALPMWKAMQQAAYVRRQRELQQYRYMMSKGL